MLIIYGKIEKGKIKPNNERYYQLELLKFEGKNVCVQIEPEKNKRTLSQNAYYWGVVLPCISETTGYSCEELHGIFKKMFLPKKFLKWRGREIEQSPTTTQLSKGEFTEYIMRISAETAELGIILPSPEDYYVNDTNMRSLRNTDTNNR